MTGKKAQLTVDGVPESIELPILKGSTGPDVVDVRGLTNHNLFTFDPGFMSTASCESKITYIDGDEGILLYRGYPIEQLAEKSDYLECCYLLLNGELPDAKQKAEFVNAIRYHTMVHEQIHYFFNGFPRHAHPMAIMVGVVGALSAFYHDQLKIDNEDHRKVAALRLIAKMPTLAAMCYKYSIGQPFMYPRNDLDFSANFLYMMFGNPCEKYEPSPVLADAMDKIFLLHADHELAKSVGGTRHGKRSTAENRNEAGENCAGRSVLHRSQPVSKRRFLFRHYPESHRDTRKSVHGYLRYRPYSGMGSPLARDDKLPLQDRPSAPAVYGRNIPRLPRVREYR